MKTIVHNYPMGSVTLNYLRAELPMRHLSEPLKKHGIVLKQEVIRQTGNVHCYMFANSPSMDTLGGIRELLRHSRVCHTCDDNFWAVHPDNPASRHLDKASLFTLQEAMNMSDFRWVTTEPLAKIIQNAEILPNLIDMDDYVPTNNNHKGCWWAGSPTHLADLDHIGNLISQMPETDFYMLGLTPRQNTHIEIKGVNIGTLPVGENLNYIPSVPFPYYHACCNHFAQKCSVGLAPLHADEFNACKSILRIQELWAMGLTVVASNAYPYNSVIKDGVNGYLVNDATLEFATSPIDIGRGRLWADAIQRAYDRPLRCVDFCANEWSWQSQKQRDYWQSAYQWLVETYEPPRVLKGLKNEYGKYGMQSSA